VIDTNRPGKTSGATPTLSASVTPTSTTTETTTLPPTPESTAPLSEQPERIVLTPDSSGIIINAALPGQTQKVYWLWAEANQSVSISVNTPDNSVFFHLQGQADGVVYKHLLDGEMSWQGVLPIAQEYVLTLDALGDGNNHYRLEVQFITETLPDNGGGPLYPIVDGTTGYLVGGWRHNSWVDAANYAPLLTDGERPYIFYNLNGEAGTVVGQPPLYQGVKDDPKTLLWRYRDERPLCYRQLKYAQRAQNPFSQKET
jgi:hypothetical protein